MPPLGRKRIVDDRASSGCFHSALRRTAQACLFLSCHHGGMPFFSHPGRFRLIRKPMAGFCSLDSFRDGCLHRGAYLCSQERIYRGGHRYLAMFIHRGPDRAFFSVEQRSLFLDGADGFAKKYALEFGLKYVEFPPSHYNWNMHCKLPATKYNKPYYVSNYFKRNKQIAEYADYIVAFIHKNSKTKGAMHTIKEAQKLNKKYIIIN